MSQKEKELTHELILRLGNKSIGHLMFNQSEIRKIGQKIDHVPPLQFFSYIVTRPELKTSLKLILRRVLTRTNFIQGAGPKLLEQKKTGQLALELEGFSFYIQKNFHELLNFSQTNNWAGFIDYIAN